MQVDRGASLSKRRCLLVATVQTAQDFPGSCLCFCVLPVVGSLMTCRGNVLGLCGTLRGGNCSIVPLYCPLTTLTGMQKGRDTASGTFRNSHTNAGIPARFFSLCCLRPGGILDTSQLLRMPQILFLSLDFAIHTWCLSTRVLLNAWVFILFLYEYNYNRIEYN